MRKLNYWQLCLAIWLGIVSLSCAQNKVTFELDEDEKLIEFTTDRFTLPNLHVTPDGKSIIFDVLGDIYKVPIEGGKAEALLQDNYWKRAGKLSPDGKTLAYVSDETGEFQIWTINLETKEKREYPIIEFFMSRLIPYWDIKGRLLIPSKEGLQSFDVITGKGQIIRPALEDEKSLTHVVNRTTSVNRFGEFAFFQKNGTLWAYDIEKNIDLFIEPTPDKAFLKSIRGSENGQNLLFYKMNSEDNADQDLVYWNLITNNLNVLNTTQTLGNSTTLNYSFDFIDDTTIILDKEGEVVRMDIKTGEYEPIPIEVEIKKVIKKPLRREPQYINDSIITASVLRNPITRKALDTIYFGAFGKLHSYAKETEVITEVYPKEDRFEVSPSLSPDGKYLAYTTWNDTEMGHVYAREIKNGKEYQLTKTAGRYINPAWSPDGTEIVFVADETEAKMGIPRQSEGGNAYNYHLDLHKIKVFKDEEKQKYMQSDTIYIIYPFSQLPRRFYPIPVYHPNGKSVFITTRNHEKDLPVLIEIDLETKEVVQERLIPFHADEVLVSPDAEHIAFIFDEQVWVDSYPYYLKLEFAENSDFIPFHAHYNGGYVNNILLPEAKSVYEVAPSYLLWQDEHTLMWGSAKEVYTYDVRTGVTEKIADIQVQRLRDIPKAQYALTNARIITMNKQDEIIERGTILVKNNRIEAVGKKLKIPEDYKVFDLEGKTIMPGLIDVHAHYHHFPYEFQVQQNYKYVGNLAYGITTIYDPSVNVLDYRERAQMVEIGQLLGPRVFASGNIILEKPGAHEYDYKIIDGIEDAKRVVNSLSKLKVYGPIKEYGFKNRKKMNWLRDAVKMEGMSITAHQNFFDNVLRRIIQGYSGIEHEISGFILQRDVLKLITKSRVNYTPTLIVRPGIGNTYINETFKEFTKLKVLNGEVLFEIYIKNRFKNNYLNEIKVNKPLKRASLILKDIVKNDGLISVGGHGNPLPGIGTHWELWAFSHHRGLTNYETLQAATINGAEKLDLQEEIGSIKVGKLADMMVLNSNPLENIFNMTDILYTIQNGCIYEAEVMKQIHPNNIKLKKWGWDSDIMKKNEHIHAD